MEMTSSPKKNHEIETIYNSLQQRQPLNPSDRRCAEEVRRSLIKQEFKANPPQPRFTRQFFDAAVAGKTDDDVSVRASFVFEMLFADLEPAGYSTQKATGIPTFDSADNIRQKLEGLDYSDAVPLWQNGQVWKNIRETEITGKSSSHAVNQLMNMTDNQLNATLAGVIDDGLKDLKRRSDGVADKHKTIDAAFDEIEQLWAKRPSVKFVHDQPSLYKKLDRYLFQSNIEQFLLKLKILKPESVPVSLGLPQNPVNTVRTNTPKRLAPPLDGNRSNTSRSNSLLVGDDDLETVLPMSLVQTSLTVPDTYNSTPSDQNEDSGTEIIDFDEEDDSLEINDLMKGINSNLRSPASSFPHHTTTATHTFAPNRKHFRRRELKITYKLKFKGELRQILNTPEMDFEKNPEWSPNQPSVNLVFKTNQAAENYKSRFPMDINKFTIEHTRNDDAVTNFQSFVNGTRITKPSAISGFDPSKIVEVTNIDTNKLNKSATDPLFDLISAFILLSKTLPIGYYMEDLSNKKCRIGFSDEKNAKKIANHFQDEKDLWLDFLGDNINIAIDVASKSTNPRSGSDKDKSSIRITAKKSKIIMNLLNSLLNKIDTAKSLQIDLSGQSAAKSTDIKLKTAKDANTLLTALQASKTFQHHYSARLV